MRSRWRIPRILFKLWVLWRQTPGQRLGQVVVNLTGCDPFYVEDDVFEARLDDVLERGAW